MKNALISLAIAVALSGCTSAQIASGVATASKYQADVVAACTVAQDAASAAGTLTLVVPQVAAAASLVSASCGSEEAIAKIVLDPLTVAWLGTLTTTLRTGGAVVPPPPVNPVK